MPGLLRGIARTAVVAGTASAVGGRVQHRQDQKWPGRTQAEPEPQYQESERGSAPLAKDRLQQLEELGELKVQGVLTEQGFATEKAKILAG
jgi:hypothetical protein